MKRGKLVWVCYDGKVSRRVPGVVAEGGRNRIRVQFYERGSDPPNEITAWFRMRKQFRRSYADGYVPQEMLQNRSIHVGLFGLPGDYYQILRRKKMNVAAALRGEGAIP